MQSCDAGAEPIADAIANSLGLTITITIAEPHIDAAREYGA